MFLSNMPVPIFSRQPKTSRLVITVILSAALYAYISLCSDSIICWERFLALESPYARFLHHSSYHTHISHEFFPWYSTCDLSCGSLGTIVATYQ
jgi:hypothetical protein